TVVAVGKDPQATLREFCDTRGGDSCAFTSVPEVGPGEVLFWSLRAGGRPTRLRIIPGHTERRRHIRKYAQGELPPERSFYFRGPLGKLNLRAQNLILFLQLAEGVDDETWLHHLKQGDYSDWFRDKIKDDVLANEAAQIESERGLPQ